MFNYFRALFVQHQWLEIDDVHRRCLVCGRQEARDTRVEILGPNSWIKTAGGRVALHFATPVEAAPTPALVPATTREHATAE